MRGPSTHLIPPLPTEYSRPTVGEDDNDYLGAVRSAQRQMRDKTIGCKIVTAKTIDECKIRH
jgi:hypothetical protein